MRHYSLISIAILPKSTIFSANPKGVFNSPEAEATLQLAQQLQKSALPAYIIFSQSGALFFVYPWTSKGEPVPEPRQETLGYLCRGTDNISDYYNFYMVYTSAPASYNICSQVLSGSKAFIAKFSSPRANYWREIDDIINSEHFVRPVKMNDLQR